MEKVEHQRRKATPHEAILLSKVIVENQHISITFLDGDVMVEQVRWHTPECIGLRNGKVVNKQAIKFWEVLPD